MSLATEIQRDLARGAEVDMPATLTWLGLDYPCSKSGRQVGQTFLPGGIQIEYGFSVTVRKNAVATVGVSVFSGATAPAQGNDCSVDSTAYTIDTLVESDAAYVLRLVDPSKK